MRCFVALLPTFEVAQALQGLAQAAAERFGGRATRGETLHLTLDFLGEVPPERLPAVEDACAAAANAPALASGFDLCLDRLACWRHKHLLWAGCRTPPAGLFPLAEDLRGRLASAIERAPAPAFTPHLTLVRRVVDVGGATEAACGELLVGRCLQGIPVWPVRAMALVESRLLANGPEHRVRALYSLGGTCSDASGDVRSPARCSKA